MAKYIKLIQSHKEIIIFKGLKLTWKSGNTPPTSLGQDDSFKTSSREARASSACNVMRYYDVHHSILC